MIRVWSFRIGKKTLPTWTKDESGVDLDSFMQKDASREIEVKRPAAVCWKLFLKQARGGQCYTDFWSAYQAVIRSASTMQRLGKKQEKRRVLERWKNTLRQRLARFVRKTLSFARNHVHA